jgi:serine/threonine protein phosphatase PrpC
MTDSPGSTPLNAAERAFDAMLAEAHLAAAHDLPALAQRHATVLGGHDAVIYLADLQQNVLVPFVPAAGVGHDDRVMPLGVDSTVAGRAFQHLQVLTQDVADPHAPETQRRVWLPLLNGTERLGVLAVTVDDAERLGEADDVLAGRLRRFASVLAELVMTKTLYADTIVRLRRTARMGLAAEIQWSLLPPLTFASESVTVAAGLEPAYEVAGDSVDYAVDADVARFAVFDGMGHGLASAQLVSLAVAAYRNARRGGQSLTETAHHIESAITEIFEGAAFATGLLGELDTSTGLFSWMSAGHLEPLLLRSGRLVRALHAEPSLPFGLGHGLVGAAEEVRVGSEQLQPGDILLLYTDGVTEARAPDGDFFGVDRLIDLVVRGLADGMPPPETMRRVTRALLEHQSGDLTDDATFLMVEWRGGWDAQLVP